MIAAFGDVEQVEIVDGLIKMSQGWGELDERNTKLEEFVHNDGWGAVYLDNGKYNLYKSEMPCWDDPKLHDVEKKRIVMMHSRHTTQGSVKKENSHPFQAKYFGQDWFFCHNGTVYEELPEHPEVQGETDSEKLFHLLMENFDDKTDLSSIEKTVNTLTEYSSLNSFLFNGESLYVVNKYNQYHDHFQLNLFMGDDLIVISSEIIELTADRYLRKFHNIDDNWEKLENGQIAKINLNNNFVDFT